VHGLALNGDRLLSGEGGGNRKGSTGGKVRLWSLSTHECIAVYAEHTASVLGVALGANVAVSASYDTTAKAWAVDSDTEEATASFYSMRHPAAVQSVSIDDGLGIAATGCGDGRARIWSLTRKVCLIKLEHSSIGLPLSCVRLLTGLLVSGGDETVKLWSLKGISPTGAPECVSTVSHGANVKGVAISANGFIASAGGNVLAVWHAT
jgi:WD40 repeat protein